ncbi:MAG TPA: hypothetical protein VNZ86_20645 [Bacteroidia bacterium]|nr:hypothetical protein [Bacteroidia bacterium]
MKRLCSISTFFLFLLCLFSCNTKQGPVQQADRDSLQHNQTPALDSTRIKYNHLIGNIPIPFEILQKLSSSAVAYKPDLLNPASNVHKYNQSNSKSMNLGVYGADLTYVISMGQFKEFASYIRTVKKLADELGIPTAFDDKTMSRFEQNKGNKDTLQNVMYGSYSEIDRSLKSDDRIGMAALVICGGWVESMYLTTRTIGTNENNGSYTELYNLMFEQKRHIRNLINLLNDFKTEPFGEIARDLEEINQLYTLALNDNHLSQDEVKGISEVVVRLRTRITNGS